ncbi:hypothetical protein IQ07DRAFT_353627 [Pyrenochaeta sp. DS3sAY3a]|nr:hypothetical protein IQ07DRAFT_353627 [Pyrenochaeta sp. DS3sAY3a]
MIIRFLCRKPHPIFLRSAPYHRSISRHSPTMPPPPFSPTQRIHWVLDWDGTITAHDTLDALVTISATSNPGSPVLANWKHVTQAYLDDYAATLKLLIPDSKLPTTIEAERKLLKELENVEQRSLDRVAASGIFAGLTSAQIQSGAQRAISSGDVQLRRGYQDFMAVLRQRQARQVDDAVSILSVNWSRRFISSCLEGFGSPLPETRIFSNELDGIPIGRPSNGHIVAANSAKIISSDDKLQQLRRWRQENEGAGNEVPIVYVGDSGTDIECLLAADLGICVRDEPVGSSQRKLAETLDRLGIKCPRLRDWREGEEGGCVWARDFQEIKEWIEDMKD